MKRYTRLAVVGDSLAEGLGDGVGRNGCWADLLATAVDAEEYLNLGERGLTASAIRTTQLEAAIRFGPDLAVVCAGGNDIFGRSFEPVDVAAELEGLIGGLAERGTLVVTFGLFDLSATELVPAERRRELRQRLLTLNAITRRTTRRHHGVHVDFFDDLVRHPGLLSADNLHPNRRGHAHIAAAVLRALSRAARGGPDPQRPLTAAGPVRPRAGASSGDPAGSARG
jgi:lysophospholipase L1-like esterase